MPGGNLSLAGLRISWILAGQYYRDDAEKKEKKARIVRRR